MKSVKRNTPERYHFSLYALRITRYAPTSVRGVSFIEVLIAIVIIALVSVGTLMHFAYALGGVNRTGNRRAALERARQRLEQLMAADFAKIAPTDGAPYWLKCTGAGKPCSWAFSTTATPELVAVDDLLKQPMETTVQWRDDPAAGTATPKDMLEIGVKVWFTTNATDDDFNRVHLRTLRAS